MDISPTFNPLYDPHNPSFSAEVDLLNERAYDCFLEENYEEAERLSQQTYQLSTNVAGEGQVYLPGIAASLVVAGFIKLDKGPYDEALNLFLRALAILDQVDNPTLRTRSYDAVSWLYFFNGDFSTARSYNERAITISETNHLWVELSKNLNTSCGILTEFNEYEEAIKNLGRSITLAHQMECPREEAIAYNNLGMVLLGMNNLAEAEEAVRASLSLIQQEHHPIREAYTLDTLGLVYQRQGKLELAAEHFQRSINICSTMQNTPIIIEYHLHLGSVLLETGSTPEAGKHLHLALEIAQRYNGFRFLYTCHEQLAIYYENLGDYQKSLEYFRQFHLLKEKIFNQEAMRRMINLSGMHKIETAQKDAEILRLRNSLLIQEIEDEKQRHAELEYQAATDAMTGLFNRRHFLSMGVPALTRALANNLPLSLIMLDVDHFKSVNDQYGHLVGDSTLIQLCEVLNSSVRLGDLCCRYGGEEFVILLPNSDLDTSLAIAERLRHHVFEMQITTSSATLQITISAGVTTLIPGDTDLINLIDRADKALLNAKASGRNKVLSMP